MIRSPRVSDALTERIGGSLHFLRQAARMTRSALALVLALLLAAAPIAMAQTPPPPPPQGPSADDLDADGIPNHLDGCPT